MKTHRNSFFISAFHSGIVRALLVSSLCATHIESATAQTEAPQNVPSPHGQSPHGPTTSGPLTNRSSPDVSLPEGEVLVEVVDPSGKKLKDVEVRLVTQFQSIAQGNKDTVKKKLSSAEGIARFSRLDATIRYSYSINITHQGAEYVIPNFRLEKYGHRVLVYLYPSTDDIDKTSIGFRGFVYVQLRADVLSVEVLFRSLNMGRNVWLPKNVSLSLPEGAQAIDTSSMKGPGGFKKADESVQLVGTFAPGQIDSRFTFQLPNTNEAIRNLKFTLPPHMAELRVLVDQAPGMTLDVRPSFEPPQPADGPTGKRVLITRRLMKAGDTPLTEINVELSGLPVIGPGRWFAMSIALVIALGGLGAALGKRSTKGQETERKQARQTLLEEMLLLKQAYENEEIGPRTFEQTKREILGALARLETAPSS